MLEALRTMDKNIFHTKKIEEMKKSSKTCQRLFPRTIKDATMFGELLFMVRFGRILGCDDKEVKNSGEWWLWAKTLFIENTMTRLMKELMRLIALNATKPGGAIHFVSARSPELIHAQISSQGSSELPRSRIALKTLSDICEKSAVFLPTQATVLLADVAIDNLAAILSVNPNLEDLTDQNLLRLQRIIVEEGLRPMEIKQLSQLSHPSGKRIGELIQPDGSINIKMSFSPRAENKIAIAAKESIKSHKRMFGWDEQQSVEHNRNIATTMALVGQAVKMMIPPAILIHNESFISRGALNNLLNDPKDPLPVICLSALLERKSNQPKMVK